MRLSITFAVILSVLALASHGQQIYASGPGVIRVITPGTSSVSTLTVNGLPSTGNFENAQLGKVSVRASDGTLLLPIPAASALYSGSYPASGVVQATLLAGTPGVPVADATGFAYPTHAVTVTTSAGEYIYVADAVNCDIRRIPAGGPASTVEIVAGAASTPGFNDGVGTNARFSGPVALAVDPTSASGKLLIADSLNYAVRTLDLSTNDVATLAGTGGVPGFSGTNFLHVRDIALYQDPASSAWEVIVADEQFVRKFPLGGGAIVTMAGNGASTYDAGYVNPTGVVVSGGQVVVPNYCPLGTYYSTIDPASSALSDLIGARDQIGCPTGAPVKYLLNTDREAVFVSPPTSNPAPVPAIVTVADVVAQDTAVQTQQAETGWRIATSGTNDEKINWYLLQAWDKPAGSPHTDSEKKVLTPFAINADGFTLEQVTRIVVTPAAGQTLNAGDLFIRVYTKPQGTANGGDCKSTAAGNEWYHASYYSPMDASGDVDLTNAWSAVTAATVPGGTACYSVAGTRTRSTGGYATDKSSEILAVSVQTASNVALDLTIASVSISLSTGGGPDGNAARTFTFDMARANFPDASGTNPVFVPSLGGVASIFSICGSFVNTGTNSPATCTGGALVQESLTVLSTSTITVAQVVAITVTNTGELVIVGQTDSGESFIQIYRGTGVLSLVNVILNVNIFGPATNARSSRNLLQASSAGTLQFTLADNQVSRMNVAQSLDLTGTNLVINLARGFSWPPGTETQIIGFGPNFQTLTGEFSSVTVVQSVVRSDGNSRSLLQNAQTASVACSTARGGCFVTAGGAKSTSSDDSNALTIALVVVSIALVLALAFAAFYYFKRSNNDDDEAKAIRPRPRDGYYAGNQDGTFNNYGAVRGDRADSTSSSSSSSSSVEDGDFAPAAARYGTIPRKSSSTSKTTSTSTSTSTSSPSTSRSTGQTTTTTTSSSSSLSDGSDSSSSQITSTYV